MHTELIVGFIDPHTQRLQRTHGIEAVFAAAIAFNASHAFGESRKNNRPMRNGFIAGNGNCSPQRPARCDRQRLQVCPFSSSRLSGADREFLAFLLRPLQRLFDSRRIARANQLFQLSQRAFIRFDKGDHIVPVPQKNVAPHLGRAGRDSGRIPQPAAGMAGQIERRNLRTDVDQGAH